jgi:hypothetical protein
MRRRFWVLAGVCGLGVPLAIVATAFACGSLATLKLNRATATAGAQVKAVGGNYNTNPSASPVQLRFNGRNGRVLWEGRPSSSGRIAATFPAPTAKAGYYVILATQIAPDGRPVAGTPGRAPLRMRRRSRSRSSSAAAVWASAPPAGSPPAASGSPLPILVGLGGGLLLLGLLGGGIALLGAGHRHRRSSAATQPVS